MTTSTLVALVPAILALGLGIAVVIGIFMLLAEMKRIWHQTSGLAVDFAKHCGDPHHAWKEVARKTTEWPTASKKPDDWRDAGMSPKPNGQHIANGTVFRQTCFPYFEFAVVMLPDRNPFGGLEFCRLSTCTPPLVMTERDGTWKYTLENLGDLIGDKKYTRVGDASITVTELEKTR